MLSPRTDNLANAVRLLVAMGGFALAPGPKSGLAVYDAVRKLAARPPKSLATMADALTETARVAFAGFREAPRDADVLFVQMVEAGLLTPQEIAAAGMDPDACVEAMLAKLTAATDPTGEMRRAEMQRLFAEITRPTLGPLLGSKEYAADLTPAYMAETLQAAHRTERKIDNVAERLDNIEAQTRDTLDALALRFGEPEPEALSLPDLKALLVGKARDYRALREEVEALRDTTPRIDNVLAAVDAAIETLDLAEADRLLASVRETTAETLRKPLEDNARVIAAQARVALLCGNAEAAARLLSTAADSFAVIDPAEPVRRRVQAARLLQDHGRHYGGDAFRHAIAMVEDDLPGALGVMPAGEMIAAFHDHASVLEDQGRALPGFAALEHLGRAAEAYRIIADTMATDGEIGPIFAAARTSLGSVLTEIARRRDDPGSMELLEEARTAHEEALEFLGPDDHTDNWIAAQSGLAATLRHLARWSGPDQAGPLLTAARAAVEATAAYRTREAAPYEWAMRCYSLATLCFHEAELTAGQQRLDLMRQALELYFDALEELRQDRYPVAWATVSYAMATCFALVSSMAEGEAGLQGLRKALGSLSEVIEAQQQAGSTREAARSALAAASIFEAIAANVSCEDPAAELRHAEECLLAVQSAYGDDATDDELAEFDEPLQRIRDRLAELA